MSQLKYLMKPEKFEKRGQVIAREGAKADKIYIIANGEFEVVKTSMSNVFYNSQASTVAVCESDRRTLIKSNYMVRECDLELPTSRGKSY